MINTNGPIFFTICSKNLLGYAKTCMESVRKNHPDSDLYIFLADRFLGPKTGFEEHDIRVVTLEEHGGLMYRDMIFRYNITEFNTSIKPYCFLHLFGKYERDTNVIYIDPDTWMISPLTEVVGAFDQGANAVLIPHMTEPLCFGNLPDRTLLRYGAYNFGFVALKNNVHNEDIMCWWADELKEHCVIDYENGLFVDQKYGDLFPSFIPNTCVLRHNGYNVAYWNLISRTFSKDTDGTILTNGEPLRFVHFSGASLSNDSDMISRHCTTLLKKHRRIYGDLLEQWYKRLILNDHAIHLKQGYSFFWNNYDKENEHTPEIKKNNNQIVPFERNQWLFMLQFTDTRVFDSWVKREIDDIIGVAKIIESSVDSHIFCNTCFNWSTADKWTFGTCRHCESTSNARLLNAFLYQELKISKDNILGTIGPNSFEGSGLSEKYKEIAVEYTVDCMNCDWSENRNELAECIVLTENIDTITENIDSWVSRNYWPNMIVSFNHCGDDNHRESMTDLLDSLNAKTTIRASIFYGLSANHALDGQSQCLLYIENLKKKSFEADINPLGNSIELTTTGSGDRREVIGSCLSKVA